jgi:hypothetical protein
VRRWFTGRELILALKRINPQIGLLVMEETLALPDHGNTRRFQTGSSPAWADDFKPRFDGRFGLSLIVGHQT